MYFVSVIFLSLSLEWYFFGACLFGLYLWERRKGRVAGGAGEIDLRRTGRGACRLGIVSGSFAFIVSASAQWIYVASGFIAGGVFGWALSYYLAKRLEVEVIPQQAKESATGQLWWFVFAAACTLAIVGIVAKLGSLGSIVLLILWSATSGLLVGWGLYVSLRIRRRPTIVT